LAGLASVSAAQASTIHGQFLSRHRARVKRPSQFMRGDRSDCDDEMIDSGQGRWRHQSGDATRSMARLKKAVFGMAACGQQTGLERNAGKNDAGDFFFCRLFFVTSAASSNSELLIEQRAHIGRRHRRGDSFRLPTASAAGWRRADPRDRRLVLCETPRSPVSRSHQLFGESGHERNRRRQAGAPSRSPANNSPRAGGNDRP